MLKISHINFSPPSESLLKKERNREIISDISFEANEGEIVGIVGESGAGKTTIAKILAGILRPTSGEILFKGKLTDNLMDEKSIQILFQNSAELLNPYRTVKEILSESINAEHEAISELLNRVELPETILPKLAGDLSGGERQRVGLLRILAVKPQLLIVDEPFSAQDVESQLNLVKLLKSISKESNLTIICISHDLQIISQFIDRLYVMRNGMIVETGATFEIITSPKHDYTKFLIKSKNYNITYSDFNSLKK